MQYAASVLAELLDNDNDGCADDPNVLANLLKKSAANADTATPAGKITFVLEETNLEYDNLAAMKLGYDQKQLVYFFESTPKNSGLNTKEGIDATIEEMSHMINAYGHGEAYPKIFGQKWTSNSALTKAMDVAR